MQTARVLEKRRNLLYPLMLIAAVTVIVFSIVGIATMMGWLPSAQSKNDPAPRTEAVVRSEGAPAPARADARHGRPDDRGTGVRELRGN